MIRIVAVSGGVDSMVLLDMISRKRRAHDDTVVVAHFDHGIREDSSEDAQFVKQAAERYGHVFEVKRETLGAQASEERARARRYEFLSTLAEKYNAPIFTAHHLDDLVETVAINFTRGTGWRGAAPFSRAIERPLLSMTKAEVLDYARNNGVTWREDSTNAKDIYLRNRVRRKTSPLSDDTKRQVHAIFARQKELRKEVEAEVLALVGNGPTYDRYILSSLPGDVALECLEVITKGGLTRPQVARFLHTIKVAKPGSTYQAGNGILVHFTTRNFTLKLVKLVG